MKILYGVQGTGNGHISRARMMAKHLAAKNIEVQYCFTGRSADQYFDMEIFGDYWLRDGLSFVTQNGEVSYLESYRKARLWQFMKDVNSLPLDDFDLVLTDFEPVTAWAAKTKGVPCVGMGHQYAFGHDQVPEAGGNALTRFIMRYFAPVEMQLGLHWDSFSAPILPPIINPELEPASDRADHVVVYLPFENQQRVYELIQKFPKQSFIVYSPELKDEDRGHIQLRKTQHHQFKVDLASARGVICNAGFELISECLHLGVPVLAKPVSKQSEQISNAAALTQLGYASIMNELNGSAIERWLAAKPQSLRVEYPDVAAAIAGWIAKGCEQSPQMLSDQLWQSTVQAAVSNRNTAPQAATEWSTALI